MLGAQYRRGCVRNVKTLELVLNVVSISGHEAGQKKCFCTKPKCAGDREDCTIPSKNDWQLLGRFRFTDVFANRNGNGNSSLPRRLESVKKNGQDVGEDDHCV